MKQSDNKHFAFFQKTVRSTICLAISRICPCLIVIFYSFLWSFSIFFVNLHPLIPLLRRDDDFYSTLLHPRDTPTHISGFFPILSSQEMNI